MKRQKKEVIVVSITSCFFLALFITLLLVGLTTQNVEREVACVDGHGLVIKNLPPDIKCIQKSQPFGELGDFGTLLTLLLPITLLAFSFSVVGLIFVLSDIKNEEKEIFKEKR